MNNKGQVLVIFVILLPIILLLFTIGIDFGLLSIEKNKIDNNVKNSLEYYLNNQNDIDIESKTKNLLEKNLDDINVTINDENDYIQIKVIKKYNGIFNKLFNNEINIIYKGNKNTKKIIKG